MNTNGRHLAPFAALEAATALSGAANGVSMVAFPWLVLELTGSASSAAAVGAITLVPLLLTSLVSGTLVDILGRRRVSVVSDLLSLVSVAAIPILSALVGLSFASPCRACRDRRLLRPGRDHRSRVDAPRGGAGRGTSARAGKRDARGDLGRCVSRRARPGRPPHRRRRRDERLLGDGGTALRSRRCSWSPFASRVPADLRPTVG